MTAQSYGVVEAPEEEAVVPTRVLPMPDALNHAVPAPPHEDDGGLPPLLKATLGETDPDLAKWRAVFAAQTMYRYHEAPPEPPLAELPPVPETILIERPPSDEAMERKVATGDLAGVDTTQAWDHLEETFTEVMQHEPRHAGAPKRRWYFLWLK
jgi:hypothetical protein